MLAPMRYNDSGERASQMLPEVKCSTCGAPVPLAALGDHVCAPPPSPGPLRPRFQGTAANANAGRAPSPLRRDFNDPSMAPPPPRREFSNSPGPSPGTPGVPPPGGLNGYNDSTRGRGGGPPAPGDLDGGRGPFFPPPREHSASPARFRGPEAMPLPPSPSSHHFPVRREHSQSPALQSPRPRAAIPPGGPGALFQPQQQQGRPQQHAGPSFPPPREMQPSPGPLLPDTTSGGSAGMAGVGRRAYVAESTLLHSSTPQPGMNGRRANPPQQLALDPRPGREYLP